MIASFLAIVAAITEIVAAIWTISKILALIASVATLIYVIFTEHGADQVGHFLTNIIKGTFTYVNEALDFAEPKLSGVANAFVNGIENNGGTLKKDLEAPFAKLAKDAFTAVADNLEAKRNIKPDEWKDIAGDAIGDAFGFGLASHAVAIAYEAVFPEKLNCLNGIGPMLATLSGFEEVSKATLGPILQAGISTPATYDANSKFRAKLPNLQLAADLHSRGLIDHVQLELLAAYEGMNADYVAAIREGAYHGINPRQLLRALDLGVLSDAEIQDELSFSGLRPASIDRMKRIAHELALQPYKQQALNTIKNAYERGTISDADFSSLLAEFNLPDGADHFIQLEIAHRKLEQLAELYRKSVTEAYQYGEITDADYVPRLEAIGIATPDAEAHYAIDSIKKRGRDAQAAARLETKLAREAQSAQRQAAQRDYLAGRINAAGLTAALIAIGEPIGLVEGQVALSTARLAGTRRRVYNLLLPEADAVLLKQQIAAVNEQATKKLITPETARAQLRALGLSPAFAEALAAKWAAQDTKTILPVS